MIDSDGVILKDSEESLLPKAAKFVQIGDLDKIGGMHQACSLYSRSQNKFESLISLAKGFVWNCSFFSVLTLIISSLSKWIFFLPQPWLKIINKWNTRKISCSLLAPQKIIIIVFELISNQ